MKKQRIIRKTKISWVITPDTVVAFDKIQATLYHVFENANKQPLARMKRIILKSTPDELNSWVEVIGLARQEGLIGYGTRLKREWFEES